jgi:hypothetical protein
VPVRKHFCKPPPELLRQRHIQNKLLLANARHYSVMAKQHKVIQVEALTYSDSFESVVDKNFRNRPLHRVEDSGPFDVERILKAYKRKRTDRFFVTEIILK